MDRTVTIKREEISGHEPQMGLDTKTGRLTDRQLQCDFDLILKMEKTAFLRNVGKRLPKYTVSYPRRHYS
jgi:hypothetical protein